MAPLTIFPNVVLRLSRWEQLKNVLPQACRLYAGESDFYPAINKMGIFSYTVIWNHVPELFNKDLSSISLTSCTSKFSSNVLRVFHPVTLEVGIWEFDACVFFLTT